MKKVVFRILYIFSIIGLSACKTEGTDIEQFRNEPAIVRFDHQQSMIETRGGTFLTDAYFQDLNDGDLLWTDFDIDRMNQPHSDILKVTNLQYTQIYSAVARLSNDNEYADSGYDPISYMFPDMKSIRNMLFFWFIHTDVPQTQTYRYEMLYNDPEDAAETPTLFIRATKTNAPASSNYVDLPTCYGFDMTSYIEQYKLRVPDSNDVKFYVMFYTGEDENGKAIYIGLNRYPITWTFD